MAMLIKSAQWRGNCLQIGQLSVRHCSSVQLCAIVYKGVQSCAILCNAQAAVCYGSVVCLKAKTAKGFGGRMRGLG